MDPDGPLIVCCPILSPNHALAARRYRSLDKFQKNTVRRERYLLHFMATLVLSLLLVNAVIRFWPTPEEDFSGMTFDTRGQETIQVEEIQQTQQEKRTPPPPVPAPPVVVPDDVVLDDIELEIADVALDMNEGGLETEAVEGIETGNDNPARADRSPSPVRIATPDYPREADRRNIRAEVVVEVLVDERGRVENARIVERYLLNKDGSEKEAVQQIGYGIEESALSAAERHTFRPAIQGGQRVKSYSTLTFRIGIDS
ncbi:MAG: TonB family protein [Bacteroidetes bacterium]|nr:TonB family protein [Bacteroidota bacterium]